MAQPRPYLLELAQQIWYPLEAKPKVHALYFQLKTQALKENWPAAIALGQKLTQILPKNLPSYEKVEVWQWQLHLAELFLFSGEPQKTRAELNRILALHPKKPSHRRTNSDSSIVRQSASYLMARTLAEQGDYATALRWQKQAPDEYWSGCGNCLEGEGTDNTPIIATWQAATLPYAQAVVALEAIRVGKFELYVTHLMLPNDSAKQQRRHAYEEASLILGELHQRAGDPRRARQALLEAARSENGTLALLARTHLRQLTSPTPQILLLSSLS